MKKLIISICIFFSTTLVSAAPPIPGLAGWEAHMISEGVPWGEALDPYASNALAEVYYDGQEVALKIYQWTGDERFLGYALKAQQTYRDRYILRNQGGSQGYRNFTMGLRLDYEMFGDEVSKETAFLLSYNAAYARTSTPLAWVQGHARSRSVAYALRSYIDTEMMRGPNDPSHPFLHTYLDLVLDHIDQLVVQKLDPEWGPFMVGLSARTLIMYYEQISPDPRIIPVLENAADIMWNDAWVAADKSFWYRADNPSNGAPDLNMLIAPMYAWLWKQTGKDIYMTRGDQIFEGGVLGAGFWSGKQFCQYFTWSFEYVKWRGGTIPPMPSLPTNQPPSVNAGTDVDVKSVCTFDQISGIVGSDDGLPNPPGMYTLTWFKDSGPGTVTFDDMNDYQTIANFSKEGTYVLRLDADDSISNTNDTITVQVTNQIQPNSYTLTAVNERGCSGEYPPGSIVRISADYAPTGHVFDRWSGDVSYINKVNSSVARVTMPSSDISVTANYVLKNTPKYTLTINGGSGGGNFAAGTLVNISANTPLAGQQFDQWTGDTTHVADVNAADTTVTMPANAINLTATYKSATAVQLPTLPQAYVNEPYNLPTGGQTWTVNAGDDLQSAIDQAQLGDVIVVEAGATFTGNFVLKNKTTGSGWIYIISSDMMNLPAAGERVNKSHAGNMPLIQSPNNKNTILAKNGVNHYRLVGLEIATTFANPGILMNIVRLEGTDNIILDRCLIHGTSEGNIFDGVSVTNATNFGLLNSYVYDIHVSSGAGQGESHGIQVQTGAGPILIENNFFEVAGINIFIGDSGNLSNIPTDVTIRANYATKDVAWKNPIPSGPNASKKWIVKNLLEFKAVNRALVEGNIFETHWAANQAHAIVFTPRGGDLSDITFRKNVVQDVNIGFNIAVTDNGKPNYISRRIDRLLIEDNLITKVNGNRVFNFAKASNFSGTHLTIRHNTAIDNSGGALFVEQGIPVFDYILVTNNIFDGAINSNGRNPSMADITINTHFSNHEMDNNIHIGRPASEFNSDPPFTNYFTPANFSAVGFKDTTFDVDEYDDFALLPNSSFAAGNTNQATDGKDMGADIAGLIALVTGVKQGNPTIPDDPEPEDPEDPESPGSSPDPEQSDTEDAPQKFKNILSREYGTFVEIPCETQINIYDRRGNWVRSSTCVGEFVSWDGRDGSGVPVPSGIYFIHENEKKTRKVVVIR